MVKAEDKTPLISPTNPSDTSIHTTPPAFQFVTLQAVFVTRFDEQEGNVIDFVYPEDYDTTGLASKTVVSGTHNVSSDYFFFTHGGSFGFGAFSRSVATPDSGSNRQSSMRVIGFLCSNACSMKSFLEFFSQQSRLINEQLDGVASEDIDPSVFSSLVSFLDRGNEGIRVDLDWTGNAISTAIDRVGPSMAMALRRGLLMRYRILVVADVPVGPACDDIQALITLGTLGLGGPPLRPVESVGIVGLQDVDDLKGNQAFVAITTDKMLALQPDLFDMVIEDGSCRIIGHDSFAVNNREKQLAQKLADDVDVAAYRLCAGLNRSLVSTIRKAYTAGQVLVAGDLPADLCVTGSDATFIERVAKEANCGTVVVKRRRFGCWPSRG